VFESLAAAIAGLQQVLTWPTPGYLLAGVLVGYVVGVLPGLGAPAALAFLLPAVVSLAPIDGFVLLTATTAVTAGAGDITSILLGVPGEATAAAIVADGHALALRGEGRFATGAAISASMMGALFGMGVLVAKKESLKYALPFGTFLAVGALVAAVAGDSLVTWYLQFYR